MNGTMLLRSALLALACVILLPLAATAAEPAAPAQKTSLRAPRWLRRPLRRYQGPGRRLVADPKLARFWANRGTDGVEREVQLIVDFLAAKSGGPLYYRGREMKLSHVGMKIDGEDWAALMKHLNATLDKFKVPAKEHAEVVAFIESTRADIVEVH